VWDFKLLNGPVTPDGVPVTPARIQEILVANRDNLANYVQSEILPNNLIRVWLSSDSMDLFFEDLKALSIVDTVVLKAIEDCRCIFPPLCGIVVGEEPGIHITEVLLRNGGRLDSGAPVHVPLLNGVSVQVNAVLENGLLILCDSSIEPGTIGRATCFVALDIPHLITPADSAGDAVFVGYQPLILAVKPEVVNDISGSGITWKPSEATNAVLKPWLNRLLPRLSDLGETGILARLSLKGNFIWAANDPELYLDGEALGAPKGHTVNHLRLPSGNGRRGGDFEMWFWLVASGDHGRPVVNINTAAREVLMALPGIGPELALRIEENRPYATVGELRKVRGIGRRTLERLRDHITL
jgi:competence ComEA-like helix-hairpin-helix protein